MQRKLRSRVDHAATPAHVHHADNITVVKMGELFKRGGLRTAFKKRFFVLTSDSKLSYFASAANFNGNTKPLGSLSVEKAVVLDLPEETKLFCLGIKPEGTERTYVIGTDLRQIGV